MKITKELVDKIDSLLSEGLVQGLGEPIPGQMCVEAAICYALGLPHNDDPQCVSLAIRELKITLNDSKWSSNSARARGMRNLAILQLGTKDNFNDAEFAKRVTLFTCKDVIPYAFKDKKWFTDELKQGIIDAGDDLMVLKDVMSASKANATAYADVYAIAAACTASAFVTATADYAAASYAAAAAASYAADAYAAAAARVANAYEDTDDILTYFTKGVEAILIDMNVPGKDFI